MTDASTETAAEFGINLSQHEGFFNLDEVRFLVYGESGAGKTVFAATWPDAVFLDIDKGLSSVNRQVAQISIDDWPDLVNAVRFLHESDHHFRTVIVDSLNEMQKICMRHIIRKYPSIRRPYDDLASQSDYGKMLDEFDKYVREIKALKLNTVYIANVAPREYETDNVQIQLVGKHSPKDIARMMDIIGYLYKVETEGGASKDRVMIFDAVNYVTKDRSGMLPNQVKNPTHGKLYEHWQTQFKKDEM